jgi:branched-subunit amino acid transport protein
MQASLWTAIAAVAAASFALKAAGPVLLGRRTLPARANRAISLLAPVLLTALILTDVAGARWNGLTWPVLLGLATTTFSRLLKAPSLVAVIMGMLVTAGFRFIA